MMEAIKRHCPGCSSYELMELQDGRWQLTCEDRPADHIFFDHKKDVGPWISLMLDNEPGPWHMLITRQTDTN